MNATDRTAELCRVLGLPPDVDPAVADARGRLSEVCPACARQLIAQRGKLVCSRCRAIVETCCDGGRQP